MDGQGTTYAALASTSAESAAYQQLSAAFVEMDMGDARFLQVFSRQIFDHPWKVTLTITHYWALVHLEPIEGRTMAELAQLLLCDRSNVTAIVDRLEERGWARRMRGKSGDRRFTSVVLTDAGRTLRDTVVRAHDQWVRVRFAHLSAAQLDQLVSLLHDLRAGLRADPEEAALAAGFSAGKPAPRNGKTPASLEPVGALAPPD